MLEWQIDDKIALECEEDFEKSGMDERHLIGNEKVRIVGVSERVGN